MKNKYFNILKFLSINLILIAISALTFSQEDFLEGYIIDNKLDTLKGLIDKNCDNFYKCKFKADKNGEIKIFEPSDIKEYRYINGKYFISKKVILKNSYISYIKSSEIDPTNKEQFNNKLSVTDTGYRAENVFIEYLLNGIVKIYYLKDKKNEEHYFIEKDSLIDLTPEKTKILYGGYSSEEINDKISKGKILYLMQDCPEMRNEIQNSSIFYNDLIRLGKDYHNKMCKNYSCVTYEQKISKLKVKFCANIGIGYSKLTLTEEDIGFSGREREYKFYDNVFYSFGAVIHFRNVFSTAEKLSFKIGNVFSKNNYVCSYRGDLNEYIFDSKVNSLKCTSYNIESNFTAIYNFSTNVRSFFAEGGLSLLPSISETQTVISKPVNETETIYYNPSLGFIGLILDFGYEFPLFKKTDKLFTMINYKYYGQQQNINFVIGYEF